MLSNFALIFEMILERFWSDLGRVLLAAFWAGSSPKDPPERFWRIWVLFWEGSGFILGGSGEVFRRIFEKFRELKRGREAERQRGRKAN